MRKNLALSLVFAFLLFGLSSCDDWEDDSWHPGSETGGGGDDPGEEGIALLKERIIAEGDDITVYAYAYNSDNRLSQITITMNDDLAGQAVYTYTGSNTVKAVTHTFMGGEIFSTITAVATVEGNTQSTTVTTEFPGMPAQVMESELTFEAPCGTQQNIVTMIFEGIPMETLYTYEYSDGNCSSKEFEDGELITTTTNDAMNAAFTDPLILQLGVVSHNPTKVVDHTANSTETITYTYNEEGYPTDAVHVITQPEIPDVVYSEDFLYY